MPSEGRPKFGSLHNLSAAIIDLGPGTGHGGGWVVCDGVPSHLVKNVHSLTAEHLRRYVGER